MRYSLGLDIGSESVGWSVVELDDDDNPVRLVQLGVRCFDAVRGERANATTPAEQRRVARGQRRRLRNRRRRLRKAAELFTESGLLKERNDLQSALTTLPGDPTPWQLRVEALDRALDAREWTRVLFHILRHRGFKSTRRGELQSDDPAERAKLGAMLQGIKGIHDGMVAHGYRTIAEYMASADWPYGEQKRNKGGQYICTVGRDDLIAETKLLFESQRHHGNPFATRDMESRYIDILDEPPTLAEGEELMAKVGRCFLEPEERRAPKASFTAERFRALQTLVNQSLVNVMTGERRRLSSEEICTLHSEALTVKKLTYKRALKKLAPGQDWLFEVRGRKKKGHDLVELQSDTLLELKGYHALRASLEKDEPETWRRLCSDVELMDELASRLTYWLRPESARQALLALGLSDTAAERLANEVVFSGHANLSLKAMRRLIPHLENGLTYDRACKEAGYDHSQRPTGQKANRIPSLDTLADFNSITNPNVKRALTQARKVVNALVAEHGLPSRVVVELAREAAMTPAKRKEIEKRQHENRKEKERYFEQIREIAPKAQPERVWRKHALYEKQGGKCAYSLKPLDKKRVLEDPTYTEVDHVIPRSISYDDSMDNKVLVLTEENRNKGDELAAVWVRRAHGDEHFRRYEEWVRGLQVTPKKKRLLLTEELDDRQRQELQGRYLVSTQYAARYFLGAIKAHLDVAENRVLAVNGRMTNDLRWHLGLGEEKNRQASDTHHAIDATICALADHKLVHRMGVYFKSREVASRTPDGRWVDRNGVLVEPPALEPWPGFREDVINAVQGVLVSRMPNHRLTGRGHKETVYSLKHVRRSLGALPARGRLALSATDPRPTRRKRLDQLTDQQIRMILQRPSPVLVDEAANWRLYDKIRQRLREAEGTSRKTWAERAFGPQAEPIRMPTNDGHVGPVVRSIRLFTDARSGLVVREGMVENDTIVRLDIYRKTNLHGKARHYVVPVYAADVAAGWMPRRAAVAHKPESEWPVMDDTYEHMFSLFPGDYFRVWKTETEPGPLIYMTSFDRGSVSISGNRHDRSNRDREGRIDPIRQSVATAFRVEKVPVDLLGRPSVSLITPQG